jgi:PAS domain S-box-containing protein
VRLAVRLQVIQGSVDEITPNSLVTRLEIDEEVVWCRTSRSGPPPLEPGDLVTVVAGSLRGEHTLIGLRFRHDRDGYVFRPQKHSSIALQLAASVLLFARVRLGRLGASLARFVAAPIAWFGRAHLREQLDIVASYTARMAVARRAAETRQAAGAPGNPTSSASKIAVGLQGAAPTVESPWWYSELLEYTHDAIIIWEMDGAGILYWNQAAEELYGHTREDARGKVTHELLRTVARKPVRDMEAILARYGVWVGELRHTARDGRIIDVEARLSLMSQRNGRWLVLEVNRDITDHARAEATVAAREASLASLNRAD